ncbi:MAG: hypothetical protein HYX24_01445 [Candidatus Aenigmarchaeota archaeon]|nr:hypothetical protein [Candidatus Aenigmarchaeota archaeon]
MRTIVCLGRPSKNIREIAEENLGSYEILKIPVVGTEIYRGDRIQITSPFYGSPMAWDSLSFAHEAIDEGPVMAIGSAGVLQSSVISIENGQYPLLIPTKVYPGSLSAELHPKKSGRGRYIFNPFGNPLSPDEKLTGLLDIVLRERGMKSIKAVHATSWAVATPRADPEKYSNDIYEGSDAQTIDLELYAVFKSCANSNVPCAGILYIIDAPARKIHEFPPEEFFRKEEEMDRLMATIAREVLDRF